MTVCGKCGSEVAEGDRFCLSCGAPIQEGPESGEMAVREKAEKRVKDRMELLQHIGIYCLVNLFIFLVWLLSGMGYPWFLWVLVPWGVLGVGIHIFTYLIGARGESMKDKMIEKEMKKMKGGDS